MSMHLSELAQVLQAPQHGPDTEFSGVSVDSRTLEKGNLFVALQGPNFDGHTFLDQAWDRGAAAAAVSQPVQSQNPQDRGTHFLYSALTVTTGYAQYGK